MLTLSSRDVLQPQPRLRRTAKKENADFYDVLTAAESLFGCSLVLRGSRLEDRIN